MRSHKHLSGCGRAAHRSAGNVAPVGFRYPLTPGSSPPRSRRSANNVERGGEGGQFRCTASRRRGWTLIELLIVCTTTGILMVTGTIAIATLMDAESRGADSLVRQTTIARLSAQFRDDLHASTRASVEGPERDRLLLELPDGSTLTYQITEGAVERRVAEGAAAGRRERFRLPEHRMSFESTYDGRIVRLVLESPGQLLTEVAGEPPRPVTQWMTIDAAIAWDLRHTRPEQSRGDSGE